MAFQKCTQFSFSSFPCSAHQGGENESLLVRFLGPAWTALLLELLLQQLLHHFAQLLNAFLKTDNYFLSHKIVAHPPVPLPPAVAHFRNVAAVTAAAHGRRSWGPRNVATDQPRPWRCVWMWICWCCRQSERACCRAPVGSRMRCSRVVGDCKWGMEILQFFWIFQK